MHHFSLKAEEQMSLSQSVQHYFGGDGDKWITGGIWGYFPNATYILCPFHLKKRLRESLSVNKAEQKLILKAIINSIANAGENSRVIFY